jgi:polyketide cyclase/dehydrase/lipid transport protein
MPVLRIKSSIDIPAAAAVVYGIIADYRVGHPSILPPQYFENLDVLEGGQGNGTRIRFRVRAFGVRQVMHARVTEPEPGRLLVETDEATGSETRFLVDPLGAGRSRVTFETDYRARGLKGWVEALLVPRYLAKVYAAELDLLLQRATSTAR